jgi:hypothetical protein
LQTVSTLTHKLVVCLLGISLGLYAQSADLRSNSDAADDPSMAPPPISCPAGAPIGAVELRVVSLSNSQSLPFQNINHLTEGDTVLYSPVLRNREKRPGEVSLVMVPAHHQPKEASLLVTDPKPADKPQKWKVPQTLELAALVYGAQGLSKRKVEGFLSQDDLLVAQLADYAEKTAQTEALVEALSDGGSSSASMNAAITGFASQYGLAVQIDKTAPPAVQAQTLFATMNPQLATYNPLGSSTAERVGQTASLATAAATLFFGSPIGLAAGGAAMLLDLRYIAFPGMQFRSSFAQPLAGRKPKDGLNLCGQRTPAPPHTRVAFIWAVRIPNTPSPAIKIGKADYLPLAQKSPLPVEVPDRQWKYLQRAREWSLQNSKGDKFPISVLKLGNQKSLEIDLTKSKISAGDYHLTGYWDWAPFQASGDVHVAPLSTFADARLEAESQDSLMTKSGKVPVTLTDGDFQFLTKVQLRKKNDEFAVEEPARFILPKGLREGPQKHADVQIDTASLDPGRYELLLTQQDGKDHAVPINILPGLPKIQNLPILANQGESTQHYLLKGERLDLISNLAAPGVRFELSSTSSTGTDRSVSVRLTSDLKPGTSLAIKAEVADRNEPMNLVNALQINGPLPAIASSHLSLPGGMSISVPPDEFPAGYNLTAMLDVRNAEPTSKLGLACSEEMGKPVTLQVGEQNSKFSLQRLSADQLFLSADTTDFPAGCLLQAMLINGQSGQSQPFRLAKIIRVPEIESFQPGSQSQDGQRTYTLTGRNLEMIEKTGWDQLGGTGVLNLPTPIPGQGQKQSLEISLPDPAPPHANLCIWLRGEKAPSTTNLSAPLKTTAPGTLSPGPAGTPGESHGR